MSEEKMDEMIKRAAASYNAPPATVPREEMWSAIRTARDSGPRILYGSAPQATSSVRHLTGRVWLGAAAAAALLVVGGIGVGRWSAAKPAVIAVASKQAPASSSVTPSGAPAIDAPSSDTVSPRGSESSVRVAQNDSRRERPSSAAAQPVRSSVPSSVRNSNSAYQLVTLTHLSDAEAMLTSFRSHTDEKMDAAMAKWARDLLTNTRLLLDSPAAADPRRRQLLEDLELTLVDIVQLSPNAGAQDRQMIEKSLDQGHVITRLRTAIPAGAQKGS